MEPSRSQSAVAMKAERRAHPATSLLYSSLAIAVGAPLYLLADTFALLPLALRDRPWPFELLAIALCVAAALTARKSGRRLAGGHVVLAVIATGALSFHARVNIVSLPPPDMTLPVGRALPSLELRDDSGARVSLRSSAPTLLVFIRAASCPYCRSQLADIAAVAPRYLRAGVRVVALSPDDSSSLLRLREQLQLPFVLLSDESEHAVTALCGARSHCQLVVDASGFVRWAGISESWSDVPAPAALLQAAFRLGEAHSVNR